MIGAITGGGIGLPLARAMTARGDWDRGHGVVLILLRALAMATVAGWPRCRG